MPLYKHTHTTHLYVHIYTYTHLYTGVLRTIRYYTNTDYRVIAQYEIVIHLLRN